jgi:beta-galactosidase
MMAVAGTIALIIVATCAVAQDRAELEVDHALTFDFATPHTDWAQPYALGTTRVLFFTDGRGTAPRECVELMQRFDIDAEAVFWARIVDSPNTHWHGGEIGEMRMLELLSQKWDCYVFMGVPFTNMSAEQQYKVLRPVTDGAGLVMVGANDERVLKADNLIEQWPALTRVPLGDAFSIGEGRGLRLPKQPDIPYHNGWEVEYDYWAEKLGHAILWAAGHEPKMTLRVDPDADEVAWDATKTFTLDVRGEAVGDEAHALMRVRTAGGPAIDLPERALPGRAFSVQVGALPAGDWHFDAWVVSSEGVETWATVPFTVTASPALSGVLLDAEWGETGDTISGKAMVEGALGPNDSVRVGLFDRRGRMLKQELLVPADGEVRFEFEIEPWMPMLVRVDAALLRNPPGDEPAMVIDSADEYVRVTRRNRGQFNFLIWDTPRGTLAPYAEQSLVENSVTLQLGGGQPALMLSAFDVSWVPYTTRVMTPKTDDGIMKPFCWNDEAAVAAHVQAKAEEYMPARRHGVFVWSLGDEVTTKGSCLSPHCAEAYRDYLDLVYGSLDALNESWTTNFANWDQVGLSKEGDNDEANSLAEGNYSRWFDRKAFQSYNFVQFCGAYAEAYSAIDPEALTGFEGAGRFSQGDDLDLIIRNNGFWSPYPGVADEVIRSIAPREFPRSNWMGYTKDADSLLVKYWRMVTRGCDAVWYWRWDCIGRFHGWLAPDLRPFPAVKEILEDTQIVRDGLGDLLLKSEMLDDDIAVMYSYPSTFACEIEDGATYGSYESAHVSFHQIIRDLGYQFSYVSDRMLRLGEFDADKYRVLILPRIEALGEAEAAVIRRYVEDGGVVIADVRPAIYDGHCKPLAEGLLDDVFGIATDGRASATIGPALIEGDQNLVFEKAFVDPTVSLTTGVARGDADGVPLMITNRYGDGAAILLNFAAASFPKLAVAGTDDAAGELMADLISRSGANAPALALLDAAGERLRNIEATRWQDGDTQIVSLFRQSGTREPATVVLPEAKHVYDLRNRDYLGHVTRFETEIIPFRASFFALCDAQTPAPSIVAQPAGVARGQVANVSISVPGATGLHAFRLTAKAGSADLDWLDQVVIAGAQPVQIQVPVAFNDPTGEYQISALELFSNQSFEATLRVK